MPTLNDYLDDAETAIQELAALGRLVTQDPTNTGRAQRLAQAFPEHLKTIWEALQKARDTNDVHERIAHNVAKIPAARARLRRMVQAAPPTLIPDQPLDPTRLQ